MKVISCAEEFSGQSSVVALGMFDGVHIGHRVLLKRAAALAKRHHAPQKEPWLSSRQ